MTSKELYDYIDSFNKIPGEYSEEELFDFGFKHKELTEGKDWQKLSNYLGLNKTGEQLRKWVLHKRYAKNLVPKNPKVLDNKTIEELSNNDVSNVLRQQQEDIYRAKTLMRDERNAVNRMLRDEARVDRLEKTVIECAKTQKELPLITFEKTEDTSVSEAILLFSDWHVGQEADNFYNHYTVDIAKDRVAKIVTQTIEYCKLHKVHTLHVLNIGDLVEGIINTNARVEQEEDVIKQLMDATEIMAQALNKLQEAAPVVTYRSVTDNHSRATPDKHQSIAKENFNMLTTWYLTERLKNTNIQFKNDNIDIGLGKFEMDCGLHVMFMHGHEDKKDKTFQNVIGATQEWVDIVCCGHWHNPSEHVFQNMRLFVNGSLCGTGPYALSNRLFTKPSQKLIIIHNKNFINMDLQAE